MESLKKSERANIKFNRDRADLLHLCLQQAVLYPERKSRVLTLTETDRPSLSPRGIYCGYWEKNLGEISREPDLS